MDIKTFIYIRLGTQLTFLLVGILIIYFLEVDVEINGVLLVHAIWGGLCLGGLVFLMVLTLSRSNNTVGDSLRTIVRNTNRALGVLSLSQILFLSIAVGICEEMLFRGAVFGALLHYAGVYAALAISSLVFGVFHFGSKPVFVFTSVYGLALGLLYYFSESIVLVTMWHFAYDFLALWFIVNRPSVFSVGGGTA